MFEVLLDSSSKYLSVGLAKDGKVIDKIFYEAWQRQSEMMTSELQTILERNNVKNSEIDAVVIGIGPGSYTGVRIAVTIGKTLAYALHTKVYSVSSLSLLRDSNKPTICVFNARSGRSYVGVYEQDKCLLKDSVMTNEDLEKYISEHKNYLVNGELSHLDLVSNEYDTIENLAKGLRKENLAESPFVVNPVYLKELL